MMRLETRMTVSSISEVDPNDSGKGYWFGTNFDEGKPGVTVKRYDNRLITWERARKKQTTVWSLLCLMP